MKMNLVRILIIIIAFAAMKPAPVFSQEPVIANAAVDLAISGVKVSFSVKDAFTRELEEAITSGVPVSFTYIVELNRVRASWFDDSRARWEFRHTVKYDSLRDEYEIFFEEAGGKNFKTGDPVEMKRLMSSVEDAAFETASVLESGEYEVRMMAGLKASRLPFFLNRVLFFLDDLDFETGWLARTITLQGRL